MKHVTDEQLVLHRYREGDDWQGVQEHLDSCSICRDRHEELVRLLAAVHPAPVPERDADYGRRVWQRLRPRLERRPYLSWRWLFEPFQLPALPRWAFAPAMAGLVLAAFWVGGFSSRPSSVDVPQLRASLEASLKAELQHEFDTKLQAVLVQARGEAVRTIADQFQSAPGNLAAAFVSQKDFKDAWADFVQTYARNRAQDRRELLALRKDLETLVVEADSKLELTREQIGHLAALTQPAAAMPRPSVHQ
jgi:hypothetical protein